MSTADPTLSPTIDLCVLLAGGLRPSPLASAAGRSVLDLSVDGKRSILQHWLDLLGALASPDGKPIPVRILHGSALAPASPAEEDIPASLDITIERETKDFRGPAGVVKDAADHLPPEATVLVIEAARWFSGDLAEIVRAHHAPAHADRYAAQPAPQSSASNHTAVTVVANRDRSPAGVVVLQRSTLDPISQLGFMDLKEQWLGRIREIGRVVRVFDLGSRSSLVLREREGLLAAARSAATNHGQAPVFRPLYSEYQQGYFAAVSPYSTIEPNTSIADSVIMEGAVVKSGAVVARSVICQGAVVGPGEVIIDRVLPAAPAPDRTPNRIPGNTGGSAGAGATNPRNTPLSAQRSCPEQTERSG